MGGWVCLFSFGVVVVDVVVAVFHFFRDFFAVHRFLLNNRLAATIIKLFISLGIITRGIHWFYMYVCR